MRKVSLSGLEKTIHAIWEWYTFQSAMSLSAKSAIHRKLLAGDPPDDPRFFGMSSDEIDDFFAELDYVTIFDLLSAAEAAIRLDFLTHAYHGKGDPLFVEFRRLYKANGRRIRLDDILAAWRVHRPGASRALSDFKGALNYRNWLAHGRYWTPKFNTACSPADVFDIADNFLKLMH